MINNDRPVCNLEHVLEIEGDMICADVRDCSYKMHIPELPYQGICLYDFEQEKKKSVQLDYQNKEEK